MRTIAMIAGLAITMAALPQGSQASCPRRTTGTVVGALTGGLLGSAVAGHGARTEGTLLGAAAGGFVGNQVTKCGPRRHAYHRTQRTRRASSYSRTTYAERDRCAYETQPYYDAYGRLVYQPSLVCRR
jgi:uncharacterized protein YcfJ